MAEAEVDIRKKLNLYALRTIRGFITQDMIEAVILEKRQRETLLRQLEDEVLPRIVAIVDHAYEAGWNEGWDDCEAGQECIEQEVQERLNRKEPEGE